MESLELNKIIIQRLGLIGNGKMYHCPFHKDNHASMSIDVEKGLYHCFSCQDCGTLRSLYYKITGKGICKELGIKMEEEYREQSYTFPKTEFSTFLQKEKREEYEVEPLSAHIGFDGDIFSIENSDLGKSYIEKRKIPLRVAMKMNFKFSKYSHSYDTEDENNKSKFMYFNNRVLVPVYEDGKLISCEGRNIFSKEEWNNYYRNKGQHPPQYKKCIYPKGSSTNTLFQLNSLDTSKNLYIVEGIMDLAVLRSDPFFNEKNSTSTFGCALTKRQLHLLLRFDQLTLIIDNDLAGWRGLQNLRNFMEENSLYKNWYFLVPPFQEEGVKDIGDIPVKTKYSITDCLNRQWISSKKSILLNGRLIDNKVKSF